ncbi:hypothetical protein ABEG63_04180 [Chryseobacterium sp. C39-AII1]|uniref:hypothetical protein n=1 Tax=Chryseobacterium sp. C39-AII1 TaxID=3080332 RepID=UPI00320B4A03
MNNYRKLLFAGLAIVPMALSSWTSNDQNVNFQNGDGSKVATVELIGDTAASSVVTSKTKKTVFEKSSIQETNVVETKVATSLDPILTFDRVLESYK